jgi:general stress protein 26
LKELQVNSHELKQRGHVSSSYSPQSLPGPRPIGQRVEDTLRMFKEERYAWVATAGEKGQPHLIPLAFIWDGSGLWTATSAASRTAENVKRSGHARIAIGHAHDVVTINAQASLYTPDDVATEVADAYAAISLDARHLPGYVSLEFRPRRVQAWRYLNEFEGRTLMERGVWHVPAS